MKNSPSVFFLLLLFVISIMACTTDESLITGTVGQENNSNPMHDTTGTTKGNRPPGGPMRIRIGASTFTATLLNNATVTAFKARLPITVSMSELNANEKLYRFDNNLPTNGTKPGTINTGDLMIYSANTLVLFYKTFPTAYSYTRLGRIDNPAGLETALGAGSVTVTFELE